MKKTRLGVDNRPSNRRIRNFSDFPALSVTIADESKQTFWIVDTFATN